MEHIIKCEDCEYYKINLNNEIGSCTHVNALPFPSPMDFCSMAKEKEGIKRGLSNEQQEAIFKRLHTERMSMR